VLVPCYITLAQISLTYLYSFRLAFEQLESGAARIVAEPRSETPERQFSFEPGFFGPKPKVMVASTQPSKPLVCAGQATLQPHKLCVGRCGFLNLSEELCSSGAPKAKLLIAIGDVNIFRENLVPSLYFQRDSYLFRNN